MKERQYDVALSFAGEDRHYAATLAQLLTAGGYSVFYDQYRQAELWGIDLYVHLSSVYKDQAHYCVIFLSEHYAQKMWTNHELKSAHALVAVAIKQFNPQQTNLSAESALDELQENDNQDEETMLGEPDLLLALAGTLEYEATDLSERHDEYIGKALLAEMREDNDE